MQFPEGLEDTPLNDILEIQIVEVSRKQLTKETFDFLHLGSFSKSNRPLNWKTKVFVYKSCAQ